MSTDGAFGKQEERRKTGFSIFVPLVMQIEAESFLHLRIRQDLPFKVEAQSPQVCHITPSAAVSRGVPSLTLPIDLRFWNRYLHFVGTDSLTDGWTYLFARLRTEVEDSSRLACQAG